MQKMHIAFKPSRRPAYLISKRRRAMESWYTTEEPRDFG
jgi:hypothetical protein